MKRVLLGLTLATAVVSLPSFAHAQVAVSAGIRIGVAPPAVRFEARPPAPSPSHVWVGGYWRWHGGQHVWEGGRWMPGRPGHVWANAHWAQDGDQWRFYEGRWVTHDVGPGPVVV